MFSEKLHIGMDEVVKSPQKFHKKPVPRIGGVCVYLGILIGVLFVRNKLIIYIMIASIPALLAGLIEDFTGRVSAKNRLLLTIFSAGIGVLLLGARIKRVDVPLIDEILRKWQFFSVLLTLIAVGGLSHGINMIDGFNGIAGGITVFAGLCFSIISGVVHDEIFLTLSIVLVSATMGFLVFNFPKGKIFLGDGGAYFVGFYLGEIAVILVNKHPEISAWFPLLVFAYPVTEVLFSIYRKKILMNRSPMHPDKLHLHMLFYKRVVTKIEGQKRIINSNAFTTLYIWSLSLICMIPAALFWNNTNILVFSFLVFLMVYLYLYWGLVKFRFTKMKNFLNLKK